MAKRLKSPLVTKRKGPVANDSTPPRRSKQIAEIHGGSGRLNKKPKLMAKQDDDVDVKPPSATALEPPAVSDSNDSTGRSKRRRGDNIIELPLSKKSKLLDQQTGDEGCKSPVTPDMQAIASSNFTLDEDTWLKRPLIHACSKNDPTNWTANAFLGEIKAHQLVEEHPHRNLVKFKGCLVKDGLVVAVLQKRYPTALNFRVEARSQPPYSATDSR